MPREAAGMLVEILKTLRRIVPSGTDVHTFENEVILKARRRVPNAHRKAALEHAIEVADAKNLIITTRADRDGTFSIIFNRMKRGKA